MYYIVEAQNKKIVDVVECVDREDIEVWFDDHPSLNSAILLDNSNDISDMVLGSQLTIAIIKGELVTVKRSIVIYD
jgi:hypothetical protein